MWPHRDPKRHRSVRFEPIYHQDPRPERSSSPFSDSFQAKFAEFPFPDVG